MTKPLALVIYRKQLGDVLLLQPALEHLARQGLSVHLDTRPGFADLLSLMPGDIQLQTGYHPLPNQVYCLENRTGATLKALALPFARRLLCLTSDKAQAWHRWLFSEYRTLPKESLYTGLAHYLLLGGERQQFAPPRLTPPPETWHPEGLPERYLLLHPTAAWARKSWPAEHWSRTLSRLDTDLPVVVTSGNAAWEIAMAEQIASTTPGRQVINLGGKTSLRQYISLTARARATCCIDGSASHLSAAFQVPTLTLFGPTNATRWHWSTPTHRCLKAKDYSDEYKPSTAAIPENVVLEAIHTLLAHHEA